MPPLPKGPIGAGGTDELASTWRQDRPRSRKKSVTGPKESRKTSGAGALEPGSERLRLRGFLHFRGSGRRLDLSRRGAGGWQLSAGVLRLLHRLSGERHGPRRKEACRCRTRGRLRRGFRFDKRQSAFELVDPLEEEPLALARIRGDSGGRRRRSGRVRPGSGSVLLLRLAPCGNQDCRAEDGNGTPRSVGLNQRSPLVLKGPVGEGSRSESRRRFVPSAEPGRTLSHGSRPRLSAD